MAPKKDTESISVRPGALAGQKCIITGDVDGQSRTTAEQILINAGATIEKSLNKKVTLVVLGEKAGEKKLEKIEELGCESKKWDDLIAEIQGEGGGGADVEDGLDEDEKEQQVEEPKPKKTKAAPKAKAPAKANSKAKAAPTAGSRSSSDIVGGKLVLITGTIPGHSRKDAEQLVEGAGANIAKSVNKSVELVILGTKPGPDKLAKIDELGIETIEWADLAEELGIEVTPEKEVAAVEAGSAPSSVEGMTLIITGVIDGHTRSTAEKVLAGAGATFAKTLNKSVDLVVLGANAGPDKLNKIADQGIDTCSWDDLIQSLGLQSEASEPAKKKAKKS